MKVLALALALDGLGLGFERKVRPRPRLCPKTQATWLLYVYAVLTLTVSYDSLPFRD